MFGWESLKAHWLGGKVGALVVGHALSNSGATPLRAVNQRVNASDETRLINGWVHSAAIVLPFGLHASQTTSLPVVETVHGSPHGRCNHPGLGSAQESG